MTITVTVQPTTGPVSLDEAKTHLRVIGNENDTYITSIITAARDYVENFTRLSINTKTIEYTLDRFPDDGYWVQTGEIRLPSAPVQSVTSVGYTNSSGSTATMASTDYIVDVVSVPARITPKKDGEWPDIYNTINNVKVTYTAGYAASTDIPQAIRHANLLMISHFYDERSPVKPVQMHEVPMCVSSLLQPYRDLRVW